MRINIAGLFIAFAGLVALQAQTTKIKSVPLTSTAPDDGKEMFISYCAVCHGMDGRGAGPAAAALKKSPADLTQLARKNNGQFPAQRVSLVLTSGPAEMLSHGSKEMPVWGRLFKSMGSGNEGVARLRVGNLTDYVKSIQAK